MNNILKTVAWSVVIIYASILAGGLLSTIIPNFYRYCGFSIPIVQEIYDYVWCIVVLCVLAIVAVYITGLSILERKFFWSAIILLTIHIVMFLLEILKQGDT